MPERDGYIAGVPCWIDTSQPDVDAAAEFYGGLFGWEFEDAMPPGTAGRYLMARLRGGDVAAVSSRPEGAPAEACRPCPSNRFRSMRFDFRRRRTR